MSKWLFAFLLLCASVGWILSYVENEVNPPQPTSVQMDAYPAPVYSTPESTSTPNPFVAAIGVLCNDGTGGVGNSYYNNGCGWHGGVKCYIMPGGDCIVP